MLKNLSKIKNYNKTQKALKMERKGSDHNRFTVVKSETNLEEKDEPSVTDTFLESPSPLGEYIFFIKYLFLNF